MKRNSGVIGLGGIGFVILLLTAAIGQAQTTIPVTDANVQAGLSPYNWIRANDSISSSVCGASLAVGFKGTSQVSILVDSPMVPRKDPKRIPVIAWTVNGGPLQTCQFGLEQKSIVLASGVQDPIIDLYIKGMSPSERRWDVDPPVNSLKILGFKVDQNAVTTPAPLPEKIWLNIGDSIMSGDGALQPEKGGRPQVWATTGDARASYGYLLAKHYGCREARLAFGGYNWAGGMAKVPALTTLIDQHTEKISRLSDGCLKPAPAVTLINLGTNGVTPEPEIIAALKKVRTRIGKECKLVVMVPVSGAARDVTTRAFNNYKNGENDGHAYLIDLGKFAFVTCDGIHPTTAGHQTIYQTALPAFDAAITGATTATTTPAAPHVEQVRFEKIVIDPDSKAEAAAVIDVNRSGHLSIVAGENWYEPTDPSLRHWQKHPFRKIEYKLEYFDDFANLPMDVNGDGYPDIISGGFFNRSLLWYENPGKTDGPWKEHLIDTPGSCETVRLWDVTGDGNLAVVPCLPGAPIYWYELKRDASGKGTGEFIKHTAADKGLVGEGIGFGDINGDGRGDFVGSNGWSEAPADRRTGQWTVHNEPRLPGAHHGIPIFIHDVNGDGVPDIIYGMAHDYGLFWLEQKRAPDGTRTWVRHAIDRRWSQAHALAMADLDGDGRLELIAGKRYRAHGDGDPGGKDPCCLYYYKFDKTGQFTRFVIDEGGAAGCGVDMLAVDVNGDGKPDIVCPGKGGLYLFLNLGVGSVATTQRATSEEQQLIDILKSQAPLADKASACRDLARVGSAESVMVLRDLLEDPQLSHMARYALEGIPGGASEAALRDSLRTLKGPQLAGVITSIMARNERWASMDLLPLLKDADPAVMKAAALAAGRIAHPLSVKVIQDTLTRSKSPTTRSACVAGLLAAGETLRTRGQPKDAMAIYDALRAAQLAPHEEVAAWRGAILSRGSKAMELLIEALHAKAPSAFQAALRSADEIPDAKLTQSLAEELAKLPPERQAPLCGLLGRRKSAASVPMLLPLMGAADKPVRLAAIAAIGQIGDRAALAPLMNLLQDVDAEIIDAALGALAGLPEAVVNQHVLKQLDDPQLSNRQILLRLAGERRIAQAMPAIIKALSDANADIRKAAIRSFGELAGMNELPRVLDMLAATSDAEESDCLEKVLISICNLTSDENALVTKIASAMPNAKAQTKAVLLRTLGVVGNAAALEAVRGASGSAEKEEKLEAIRVLGNWKTADAAPILLDLAKTSDQPTAKLLALRGYLGMANRGTLAREDRSKICRAAAPLVQKTDQKRMLLSAMASIADPNLIDLILPMLDDPAVRRESVAALTKLVAWTGKRQVPLARQAVEKLLTVAAKEPDTVKQAQEMLNKLNAIK